MRLIDADEYKEKLYAMMPKFDEENDKKCIEGQTIFFCIATLDDMPTITPPPNTPLTLEELREMDGEPVWFSGNDLNCYEIFCGVSSDGIAQFHRLALPLSEYGKAWLAYRRRPEEVIA
ncbi:MAG: hypothetical protein HFF77_03215 [Oscillospiraceae bacterium]|jgi:hypothetical protein|nr:hypothetical protein [Oscillospiraceae bacterium]